MQAGKCRGSALLHQSQAPFLGYTCVVQICQSTCQVLLYLTEAPPFCLHESTESMFSLFYFIIVATFVQQARTRFRTLVLIHNKTYSQSVQQLLQRQR